MIARIERPETYDAKLWRTVAAEIGIAGLLIPEALGGAGASYRELAAAAEQFGAFVTPIRTWAAPSVATAALLSAARGAAEEANAVAGRVGARRPRWTSGRGSPARPRPPARPSSAPRRRRAQPGTARTAPVSPAAGLLRQLADGRSPPPSRCGRRRSARPFPGRGPGGGPRPGDRPAGLKLRGTVRAVADALPAEVLLVPAEGVPNGLFLVDATAPGVHRTPVVSLDMTRQLCDISFDGAGPGRSWSARPPRRRSSGPGGRRGGARGQQLGLAQHCLDLTVAYVRERRQFARPVGSFQALKHRLADLWTTIAQARAASRYAAACLADGDPDTRSRSRWPSRPAAIPRCPPPQEMRPAARRHRLHLGAPGPPVPQARQGGLGRLRHARRPPRGPRRPGGPARPRRLAGDQPPWTAVAKMRYRWSWPSWPSSSSFRLASGPA